MTAASPIVRKVELHEWRRATEALADAFEADPVAQYLTTCDGNTAEQARALDLKVFEYIIYAHLLRGMVLEIDDFQGIACWMPPNQNMDDWATILRSGMWRLYYQFGTESKQRYFNEFLPKLHDAKAKVMGDRDENSWYLIYIGTVPSARGKGYSRKLVEYVTDIADRAGQACYLESSTAQNLPIYERYGFEEKLLITLDRAQKPVPLHCMIREPKITKDDSDD
ncbi:hypothetical protein D0Z03_002866 [Geotrichum reessii]|nr:hypothetical protein D0Z03_002866 [Galactomyces reessii]